MKLEDLRIKIFADGADLEQIRKLAKNPLIKGFTTNPSLLRKAGVTDYAAFAKDAIAIVAPRPISFEVFADDLLGMERQARIIAGWGENVYVKIPVMNTEGHLTIPLITALSWDNIKVNITAVMMNSDVQRIVDALHQKTNSIISIFAGRIADTARDPVERVKTAIGIARHKGGIEILWASPREVFNVYQANDIDCHIITAAPDILAKLPLFGKDLSQYTIETVRMFRDDAVKAGYSI